MDQSDDGVEHGSKRRRRRRAVERDGVVRGRGGGGGNSRGDEARGKLHHQRDVLAEREGVSRGTRRDDVRDEFAKRRRRRRFFESPSRPGRSRRIRIRVRIRDRIPRRTRVSIVDRPHGVALERRHGRLAECGVEYATPRAARHVHDADEEPRERLARVTRQERFRRIRRLVPFRSLGRRDGLHLTLRGREVQVVSIFPGAVELLHLQLFQRLLRHDLDVGFGFGSDPSRAASRDVFSAAFAASAASAAAAAANSSRCNRNAAFTTDRRDTGATSASIARFARSVIRRGADGFFVACDFAASASEATSTMPPGTRARARRTRRAPTDGSRARPTNAHRRARLRSRIELPRVRARPSSSSAAAGRGWRRRRRAWRRG